MEITNYSNLAGDQTTNEGQKHMFEVRLADRGDALPLGNLVNLYIHDIADYWDDMELNSHGLYGWPLDKFFSKNEKFKAFLFYVNGNLSGFALVDDMVCLKKNEIWMSQFFVVKKHRRKGLAAFAATRIFDTMRGKWELGQMPKNLVGQAFWRNVIAKYTNGSYVEEILNDDEWEGPVQYFDNSLKSPD